MTPGYEADMRRIIGRDVTCRTYARGVIVSLPCTGGHTVEHQMEKMLPPRTLPNQPRFADDIIFPWKGESHA